MTSKAAEGTRLNELEKEIERLRTSLHNEIIISANYRDTLTAIANTSITPEMRHCDLLTLDEYRKLTLYRRLVR